MDVGQKLPNKRAQACVPGTTSVPGYNRGPLPASSGSTGNVRLDSAISGERTPPKQINSGLRPWQPTLPTTEKHGQSGVRQLSLPTFYNSV